MTVEGIELVRVELPLAEPWVTALGTVETRRVTLVRAVVDGAEGWGECVAQPEPTYSAEYEDGAWALLIDHLVPRLLDGRGTAAVKGNPMARAALDTAVLDAQLRAGGVALVDHLRSLATHPGPRRATVPSGVAVGVTGDVGVLLDTVASRVGEGYRRVKVKIHPGWDIVPVAAVRAAHPGLMLQVDANGAYAPLGPAGAAAALAPLDDLGLLLVEQPLGDDDLVGHAELGRRLRTPVCLDESIGSEHDMATAVALGACRAVNVKAGRVGGLAAAVAVAERAVAAGMAVWCGGMLETGVGRAANLALASLGAFTLPGDLSAASRYWEADIVEPAALLTAAGEIAVPSGPGIGVEVTLAPDVVTGRVWCGR
jgi:O-succinylbenzoate synthase